MAIFSSGKNCQIFMICKTAKVCKATCTAVAMSSSVQDPQPLKGKEIAMAFLCAKLASIAAPKVPDDNTDALAQNSSTQYLMHLMQNPTDPTTQSVIIRSLYLHDVMINKQWVD